MNNVQYLPPVILKIFANNRSFNLEGNDLWVIAVNRIVIVILINDYENGNIRR